MVFFFFFFGGGKVFLIFYIEGSGMYCCFLKAPCICAFISLWYSLATIYCGVHQSMPWSQTASNTGSTSWHTPHFNRGFLQESLASSLMCLKAVGGGNSSVKIRKPETLISVFSCHHYLLLCFFFFFNLNNFFKHE